MRVRIDVGGPALRSSDQQCPGVSEYQRVVVDVDHACIRRNLLRHLMGVGRGRQPGPDVQELSHPRLASQVLYNPAEESSVRPGHVDDGRERPWTVSPAARSAA